MKKFSMVVMVMCLFCLMSTTSDARSRHKSKSTTTVVEAQDNHNVAGAKIDAPNLVQIDKEGNWMLGVEGGKDIMKNIFYSDNDFLEADNGY